MGKTFQAFSFLNYWFNAIEQHSLHSPLVYELYQNVINTEYPDPQFYRFEKIRGELLADLRKIEMNDLGAGSKSGNKPFKTIREITQTSLTNARVSRLLYRLIKNSDSKTALELGTSLGINALYMIAASEGVNLATFEGNASIAKIALESFQKANATRAKIIEGNIDKTLHNHLGFTGKIDFVYIDANHTYEATTHYFNLLLKKMHDDSIIVIGDIHWSKEMAKAWQGIRSNPVVTLSIDLYYAGILMFKPDLLKQHYILAI